MMVPIPACKLVSRLGNDLKGLALTRACRAGIDSFRIAPSGPPFWHPFSPPPTEIFHGRLKTSAEDSNLQQNMTRFRRKIETSCRWKIETSAEVLDFPRKISIFRGKSKTSPE